MEAQNPMATISATIALQSIVFFVSAAAIGGDIAGLLEGLSR
jgi:hypothetical protein